MDPGLDPLINRAKGGGVGKSVWHPQFNKSGKGKGVWHPQFNTFCRGKDKIKSFGVSQKVWVGGFSDAVTWKALQELADTVGKSKWVEILGKGQACVCYGTAEEAQTAIATLNGSFGGDVVLQFDVWTKKEKA